MRLTRSILEAARLEAIEMDAEAFVSRNIEDLVVSLPDDRFQAVVSSYELEDAATIFGDHVWFDHLKDQCEGVAGVLVGSRDGVAIEVKRHRLSTVIRLSEGEDEPFIVLIESYSGEFSYCDVGGTLEGVTDLIRRVVENDDEEIVMSPRGKSDGEKDD